MPKCPHCGAPYHRQPGDVHEQWPIVYTCNCQRGWNMTGHTNSPCWRGRLRYFRLGVG